MAEKKSEFERRREAFEKSFGAKNWNEAIKLGEALRQDFPEQFQDNTRLINRLSSAYYNRGKEHEGREEFNDAITDYTSAIEIRPNFFESFRNRGVAYYRIGEYDKAIADETKAIDLKPDDATAHYDRGTVYLANQDYSKAIADFDKAIKQNPNFLEAYANRGNAYAEKGEHDNAIADYDKAIALKPDDTQNYYNRAIAIGRREAKKTEEQLKQSYEERLASITEPKEIEERFRKRKKQALDRLRSLRSSSDRLSCIIIFTLPLIWALLAYFLFFYCTSDCKAFVDTTSFWSLPRAFASLTLATLFLHLPIFLRIAHLNRNARIERHVLEDYERKIVILNLSKPGESIATILKHIDKRGTPEVLNRLYHPKYAYPHRNNAKDEGDDEKLLERLVTLLNKTTERKE